MSTAIVIFAEIVLFLLLYIWMLEDENCRLAEKLHEERRKAHRDWASMECLLRQSEGQTQRLLEHMADRYKCPEQPLYWRSSSGGITDARKQNPH
jgi:hypothetical protein